MYVLGIGLRSSVLAVCIFSQKVITPAQNLIVHVKMTKFIHLISIKMCFHLKWQNHMYVKELL